MILSISSQAIAFLASALAGFGLGFFYDFFRILRRVMRHKTAATTIQDALFWIAAVLVIFYFLLHLNQGQIRGYLFLGALLGIIVYLHTLSRLFVKFAVAVLNIVKKGLLKGARCVRMKGNNAYQKMRGRCKRAEEAHPD